MSNPEEQPPAGLEDGSPARRLQLRTRWTFIDVRPEPSSSRRSTSHPGRLQGSSDSSGGSDTEFAQPLADRMGRMEEIIDRHRENQGGPNTEGLPLSAPPAGSQVRSPADDGSFEDDEFPGFRRFSSESASSRAHAAPLLPGLLVRPMAAEVDTQSSTELMDNVGSAGHPELCARRCIFHAAGHCTNGSSCGYCHYPHEARPIHLDKRHRELLRMMSAEKRLALLLPVLQRRADILGIREEAEELLTVLARRAASEVSATNPLHPRLLSSMKKMTFTTVLGLAVRGGRAPPQEGEERRRRDTTEAGSSEEEQGAGRPEEPADTNPLDVQDALARLRLRLAARTAPL